MVLYYEDADACVRFWTERVGTVEKGCGMVSTFQVVKVGFPDRDFAFELATLELLKDNPDGLDLATPSMAFHVDSLEETHASLSASGVETSEISEHSGMQTFAFADNENRWFAVIRN